MQKAQITKTTLAQKLGVARSTLYYKEKKPAADESLKIRIQAVMADNKAYGHRRVADALDMNKKPVLRVMNKYGLRPKIMRGLKPSKPDDQNREEMLATNISKEMCPIAATVIWAGDFTYFWFQGRWWYLATVIDIFTREIVGWHVASHHTTALIAEAFKDAVSRAGKVPWYFHSDQGSEYVSGEYKHLLTAHGVKPSFSKKASPWQNGFQESFYSNFKLELGNVNRFENVGQLIEAIHRQIAYYNESRIHSALKMPPTVFRESLIYKQKLAATAAI